MPHTTLIDTATLAAHLDDPDWVVVDCRFSLADTAAGERAWHAGHLPGARYAHLDRDLSGPITPATGRHPLPDPLALAERLGAWGIDGGVQVVAYDDAGGSMAVRLWWLLRWLGHQAVAVLDGGVPRWQAEGRPLTDAPPQVQPRRFAGRADDGQWLTTEQVARQVADGTILLLDARTEPRYRGEQEPIDPVAGRVPGSLNHPLQRNLAADGRFLPADELRRLYEALLAGRAPAAAVHLCGSGVTAIHNLLAMEHAGLPGSRLYAGSWSEWIRDPARPVARGTPRPGE